MNVRFWEFINGSHVKITLCPGQRLAWDQFERTDEGWSETWETWELSKDGLALERECGSDGQDCDGRLSRGHTAIASADPFTFVDCYEFAGKRPDWQDADDWQRDQFAEAAGY
jgi:hypothetical protein